MKFHWVIHIIACFLMGDYKKKLGCLNCNALKSKIFHYFSSCTVVEGLRKFFDSLEKCVTFLLANSGRSNSLGQVLYYTIYQIIQKQTKLLLFFKNVKPM